MRADRRNPNSRGHRFDLGDAILVAAIGLVVAVGCIAQATAAPPAAQSAQAAKPAADKDAPAIAFPTGYAMWTHIKSGLINAPHPAFPSFGGLHHVYGNAAALEGFRSGRYPDGAVLVYDLFETRDHGDGIIDQGPRRHIDVMVKDSARFKDSGGWGYAEFAAGQRTDRLKTAQRDGCAACHATRRQHGDVFSEWANVGEQEPSAP
jgi:hypothetical protein